MPPSAVRHYFAYGSNLLAVQMARRCPDSQLLGRARLPRHRWLITQRGHASVEFSAPHTVEGRLWLLSAADEDRLDGFEDVATGEYRKAQLAVDWNQQVVNALVYIDTDNLPGTPSPEYVDRIIRGIREAELSVGYIEEQIKPWLPIDRP